MSSCLSILGHGINQIPIKLHFQNNPLARIHNNEHVQHITCIYLMQDRANKKLITYVNYWKSVDLQAYTNNVGPKQTLYIAGTYLYLVIHVVSIVKFPAKFYHCILAKEGPLRNIGPPPTLGLIKFLLRSNVYSNMRPCVAALEKCRSNED